MTDAMREMNKSVPMLAFQYQGKRYDVGDKFGYIEATIELALQKEELRHDVEQYIKSVAARLSVQSLLVSLCGLATPLYAVRPV